MILRLLVAWAAWEECLECTNQPFKIHIKRLIKGCFLCILVSTYVTANTDNMFQISTQYEDILAQIKNIDPISYSRSRNFLNGKVTKLSPYLTHGVITLNQIKIHLQQKFKSQHTEKLIFELFWKEYFLRVWEHKQELIWTDLKHPQDSSNHLMPNSIYRATTGIAAIDQCISELYETGYMHNHARMWTASIVCNIGKSHWLLPSKWMYYHLLDGDLASNTLSWQWVAGTFSSKKYYANQDNINKFASTTQTETFLDIPYGAFEQLPVPVELESVQEIELQCDLKSWVQQYVTTNPLKLKLLSTDFIQQKSTKSNLILFHPWMLNPHFGSNIADAEKILIFEPSHFLTYPMSQKRINFILDLASNIERIQVFVGEVSNLDTTRYNTIVTQKYPAIAHWSLLPKIKMIDPDYMQPNITGYYSSFMSYWKHCEKLMY
jgi:deoxyribodipyrimidine photo-lyase